MATRVILKPHDYEPLAATGYAAPDKYNARPVLAFDAGTDESAVWTFLAPQGLTGTITVYLQFIMASATTGAVVFTAEFEAVTGGDAVDLDATTSFDTANSATSGTVPGTAGYLATSLSITMTNADSIAAGDYVRLRITRDADNASDTAAGDCGVLLVEVRDAA